MVAVGIIVVKCGELGDDLLFIVFGDQGCHEFSGRSHISALGVVFDVILQCHGVVFLHGDVEIQRIDQPFGIFNVGSADVFHGQKISAEVGFVWGVYGRLPQILVFLIELFDGLSGLIRKLTFRKLLYECLVRGDAPVLDGLRPGVSFLREFAIVHGHRAQCTQE